MKRLWRQIIGGERGQALPIVLSVMIIGGLMIAPALNHISTSLNAGRMVEENVKGIYAAEAGVEDVLWLLTEGIEPPEEPQLLPENVNQMEVLRQTEGKGSYALYQGEFIEVSGKHYDYLAISGEMVWIEEEEAYEYTITVAWQPWSGYPTIHLEEVGVRLPIGYEYVEDSADEFEDNLSTDEPYDPDDPIEQDWAGAYMPNWELGPSYPSVSQGEPMRTQKFYVTDVTGEGEREGDYTWAGTHGVTPIGQVGEVIGTFYSITSTATHPESGATTVVADVVVDETDDETDDEVYIVRWQINPE